MMIIVISIRKQNLHMKRYGMLAASKEVPLRLSCQDICAAHDVFGNGDDDRARTP